MSNLESNALASNLVVDENEPILEEYARLLFGIGLMERGRIYWQFFTIAGELEWWKRGKI
jgi:hypothetical protein